ncbi:TPA: hypothetical protein ACIRVE_002681 [Pseudomonas putida]|uniref:hypothetical protein n=1 Tax=Pseudomonas sp. TaxID=306 RepID=UPI0028AB7051|nr:hypothetical protein [Pseudomonas sp.]
MSETATPATPADRFTVEKLIGLQIEQVFDAARMQQVWERTLANCDPVEFAAGMCMALSGGRFTRRPQKMVAPQFTFNISGPFDAQALADAFKAVFDAPVTGHG